MAAPPRCFGRISLAASRAARPERRRAPARNGGLTFACVFSLSCTLLSLFCVLWARPPDPKGLLQGRAATMRSMRVILALVLLGVSATLVLGGGDSGGGGGGGGGGWVDDWSDHYVDDYVDNYVDNSGDWDEREPYVAPYVGEPYVDDYDYPEYDNYVHDGDGSYFDDVTTPYVDNSGEYDYPDYDYVDYDYPDYPTAPYVDNSGEWDPVTPYVHDYPEYETVSHFDWDIDIYDYPTYDYSAYDHAPRRGLASSAPCVRHLDARAGVAACVGPPTQLQPLGWQEPPWASRLHAGRKGISSAALILTLVPVRARLARQLSSPSRSRSAATAAGPAARPRAAISGRPRRAFRPAFLPS